MRVRGGLPPRALRNVREFIEAHLEDNISIQALAAAAGLSMYHFARAFKQSEGVSPHHYVVRRRVRSRPGSRIKAIAPAGSGSMSASCRAATDGQCVKRRAGGNDRNKALTMARMDRSKRQQSRSIGGKRVQDPGDVGEVH